MSKLSSFLWGLGLGIGPSLIIGFLKGEGGFYEIGILASWLGGTGTLWGVLAYVVILSFIFFKIGRLFLDFSEPNMVMGASFILGWIVGQGILLIFLSRSLQFGGF